MLVCDAGNTQTVFGYFKNDKLIRSFRINTDIKRTSDEYKIIIKGLLEDIGVLWEEFETITIASVVPRFTETISRLGSEKNLITVSHKSKLSFNIKVPEPQTLGADRIVNSEAAIKKYSTPLIIVDCGTATTFDVINREKEYIGGAITPGIYISAEALFANASKLFSTTLAKPQKVIGNDTKRSLQSGIVHGFGSLIDGMVWKIKKELACEEIKVIGTGGQIDLIKDTAASIDTIDNDLPLEGLLEIYKNEKER